MLGTSRGGQPRFSLQLDGAEQVAAGAAQSPQLGRPKPGGLGGLETPEDTLEQMKPLFRKR